MKCDICGSETEPLTGISIGDPVTGEELKLIRTLLIFESDSDETKILVRR